MDEPGFSHQVGGNVVDCDSTGRPAGDHDREDPEPDGHGGDDDKSGGGYGAHNVGPHAGAVQDAHPHAQL